MSSITFEMFKQESLAKGFDEVLERQWAPDTLLDTHTHPFSVQALVTQGEMWLSCAGSTRHLLPGATFELARDVPHSEKYGPAGATYWVARKNS